MNTELLAIALRMAEQAHAEYEKKLGRKDEDWAKWYAVWLIQNTALGDTPCV